MRTAAHHAAAPVESEPASHYRIGPFRVEADRRKLWKGDELVQLSPKSFDLLVVLVAERHRVVDKDELMRRLWPDTVVGDESVTQSISALRRALGDDRGNPEYIATIPRRGYRFIGPVVEEPGGSEPGPSPEPGDQVSPAAVPASARTSAAWVRPAGTWAAAALVLAAIAVVGAAALRPAPEPAGAVVRFTQERPPATALVSGGALSPDGRWLAFLARDLASRTTHLWVREISATDARRLPGTQGATRPFWSPDSRAIGFFSDGQLRTLTLADETVRTLATVGPLPVGGTWSTRNVIVFGDRRSDLSAVFLDTGAQRSVTALNRARHESAHRFPHFLPDGEHFLYFANSPDAEQAGTWAASISATTPPVRLLPGSAAGVVYLEPGYLAYVSDGRLLAHPFDPERRALTGRAIMLAADVDAPMVTNATFLSASRTGLLAYGGGAPQTRLVWYDPQGTRQGAVEGPVQLHNPVITADGSLALASHQEASRRGVWAIDARGAQSRVISNGVLPVASPDGRRVAFSVNRAGVLDLFVREIGGTSDVPLFASPHPKTVSDWTRDGRTLVFVSSHPTTKEDLWMLPLTGGATPVPLLQTPDNELQGEISPDQRWIAYTSDESGAWEVYVQRFPAGGWKQAVSIAGGAEPHWQRAGGASRLFYLASDQWIMAVDIAGDRVGAPRRLFRVAVSHELPTIYRNVFAVSPDGSRFLIDSVDGPGTPLTIVVNWPSLLRGVQPVPAS